MGRTGTDPRERHTEKELETERRIGESGGAAVWMEREKDEEEEGGVHRPPQIHGFDICVLLDSLLTARLSCPPRLPSTFFSCFLHLPYWSAVKGGKTVWEGAWDKTDPFSLDAVLCQACRDTFKAEREVNVVGRMREPLKLSTNVT